MSARVNHPCAHCGAPLYSFAEAQQHHSGQCPRATLASGGSPPECPVWADGRHCYVEYYRNCEGVTGRAWQPESKFTALKEKRCACGATVGRVKS